MPISLGGAIGATARYWLDHVIEARSVSVFPVSLFTINVSGCFLIGLVTATLVDHHHLPAWVRLGVVVVGVIGGYTTFSTFAQEALDLGNVGQAAASLASIVASVGLGMARCRRGDLRRAAGVAELLPKFDSVTFGSLGGLQRAWASRGDGRCPGFTSTTRYSISSALRESRAPVTNLFPPRPLPIIGGRIHEPSTTALPLSGCHQGSSRRGTGSTSRSRRPSSPTPRRQPARARRERLLRRWARTDMARQAHRAQADAVGEGDAVHAMTRQGRERPANKIPASWIRSTTPWRKRMRSGSHASSRNGSRLT